MVQRYVNKVPRVLITPVGTPMWSRWTHDHDIADPQAKMRPSDCGVPASTRFCGPLSRPCAPAKNTAANAGCDLAGVAPVPMCTPIMPRWANDHDVCTSTNQDGSNELDLK